MIHALHIHTTPPKSNWTSFINSNRLKNIGDNIDEVHIDFSDCIFIEPFHLVALACLIEEYYLNGIRLKFLEFNNLELKDYLNNINFFDYWKLGFNRNSYTPSVLSTNLCLWKLDVPMISEYVVKAQEYFENNFLENFSAEPLNISLAEAFNNINDHAMSPVSGYCLSQYYPNIRRMKISVCDFGKGIPTVLNNYLESNGEKALSDCDAIVKSLEHSFSTNSHPYNRGYGLDTIKTIVKSCNGSLRILSNKGSFFFTKNAVSSSNLENSFGGTHIEIILDTSTFDQKENELYNDDFEL